MLELFVLLHTGFNWPLWDIINLPINRLTKASGLLRLMPLLNSIKDQLLFWNGEVTVAPSSECRPPAEGAGGRFAPTLLCYWDSQAVVCRSARKLSLSPTSGAWQDAVTSVILPVSSSVNLRDWFQWAGAAGGASFCPPAAVFLHWRWQRLLPMGFASFIYESEAKNGEWWSSLGLRVWVGKSGTAEVPARVNDESQLLRSHCCKHVYTFPACEAKRLHKLSWKTRGHSCSLQKAIALKVRPADKTSGTTPLCAHARAQHSFDPAACDWLVKHCVDRVGVRNVKYISLHAAWVKCGAGVRQRRIIPQCALVSRVNVCNMQLCVKRAPHNLSC